MRTILTMMMTMCHLGMHISMLRAIMLTYEDDHDDDVGNDDDDDDVSPRNVYFHVESINVNI